MLFKIVAGFRSAPLRTGTVAMCPPDLVDNGGRSNDRYEELFGEGTSAGVGDDADA